MHFHWQIRDLTLKDTGWYDCQVNTEPKISNKSYLTVFERTEWKKNKMQDSPVISSREEISQEGTTEDFDIQATTTGKNNTNVNIW